MPEVKTGSLTRYTAVSDGRLIGLLVPFGFSEFIDYHPNDGRRSYVTDPNFPLQIVTATGAPSDIGSNHIHQALPLHDEWPTRHKVVVCLSGAVQVELSEADGTPIGIAVMGPGDAVMSTEGHRISYLERASRLLEIKQGPYPGNVDEDRVFL
jgi:hypothetical protein